MGKHIQWRAPNEKEPASFGEDTVFGGGRTKTTGYLAHSQRVGPGVVLVHDAYGLTTGMRQIADALCTEGFTVLAPDMYGGAIATDAEHARSMAHDLDLVRAHAQVAAAALTLRDNWHPRVGGVGFSIGAMLVSGLARDGMLDAAVLYCVPPATDISGLPVLLHLAEADELLPSEDAMKAVEGALDAGVDLEVQTHPSTRHRFFLPTAGEDYNEHEAAEALLTTAEFLHHHLA